MIKFLRFYVPLCLAGDPQQSKKLFDQPSSTGSENYNFVHADFRNCQTSFFDMLTDCKQLSQQCLALFESGAENEC